MHRRRAVPQGVAGGRVHAPRRHIHRKEGGAAAAAHRGEDQRSAAPAHGPAFKATAYEPTTRGIEREEKRGGKEDGEEKRTGRGGKEDAGRKRGRDSFPMVPRRFHHGSPRRSHARLRPPQLPVNDSQIDSQIESRPLFRSFPFLQGTGSRTLSTHAFEVD